jgi:prepilin-type N-terminal cleavage/methylation domain-containing protein
MKRKGFTLIELMVVILIVAILAAVAIPILRARIDSAKWSEGKAMMGTIATAIRAFGAEYGEGTGQPTIIGVASNTCLGFAAPDLTGTYFNSGDFRITNWSNPVGGPFTYSIQAIPTGTNPPSNPTSMTLSNVGGNTTITAP